MIYFLNGDFFLHLEDMKILLMSKAFNNFLILKKIDEVLHI